MPNEKTQFQNAKKGCRPKRATLIVPTPTCSGSPTWTRTRDLRINSPSLYQLSYQGKEATLYPLKQELATLFLHLFLPARFAPFAHPKIRQRRRPAMPVRYALAACMLALSYARNAASIARANCWG